MIHRLAKLALCSACITMFSYAPLDAGMLFIPLGDLPGAFGTTEFHSVAHGVSNDGSTVVGQSASGAHGFEAFRWTADEGMTGLGFSGTALDVSADGSVIVGGASGEAFRWTSGTGKVGLGDLDGGASNSVATGVSADGSVITGTGHSGTSGQEAFRWHNDVMQGLGTGQSVGAGISDNGSLIGGFYTNGSFFQGFKSIDGGPIADVDAPPRVYTDSVVHAVNDNGDFVGAGKTGGAITLGPPQAFLNLVALGDFASGGESFTVANDLSGDAGRVIGYGRHFGISEAFLWTLDDGIQPLRDLLVADGNNMTGWHLTEATAISSNGKYIVGYGTNPDGHTEAWLIGESQINSVPEPSSLVLFCGMTAMLFVARRRRIKDEG